MSCIANTVLYWCRRTLRCPRAHSPHQNAFLLLTMGPSEMQPNTGTNSRLTLSLFITAMLMGRLGAAFYACKPQYSPRKMLETKNEKCIGRHLVCAMGFALASLVSSPGWGLQCYSTAARDINTIFRPFFFRYTFNPASSSGLVCGLEESAHIFPGTLFEIKNDKYTVQHTLENN